MKIPLPAFALFVALLASAAAQPANPAPAPRPAEAEILKLLAERVDTRRQSLGMVVGIIDPAGRKVVAHGVRAKGDPLPLDGDTVFEIGSINKAFTSLLLADAVMRGEVSLSDPASRFLPSGVTVPERNGKAITLQHLSMHFSGLPREPANLRPKDPDNPYADYNVEHLYAFLSGHQLTREVGERFEYSNLGAGLLGHALARRSDTSYAALIQTRITGPLGMKDTAAVPTPGMRARLAPGHNQMLAPVPAWDTRTLEGAGGLRSTANDLLIFLAAALGLSETPLASAFSTALSTRQSMDSPQADVALGWGVVKANDTEIYWSNGRTGGYRSWVGIEPRSKTGVVILTNTNSAVEPDDLGFHLLNSRFRLRQNFPPPPRMRTETKLAPAAFDRLAGRYQFAPGAVMSISRTGERFFAQLTGQPTAEIFAESEQSLFYKVVDAALTFETDPEGKVTGLVLHQGGKDQRAGRVD